MKTKDTWNSQIGAILAVAGAAVGLGNFLRFPGQAAQFGGGAFMIAYFISLIILGIPMGWMEWIVGRYGGQRGFCSPPGLLTTIWKHPMAKYVGACAALTTLSLYCYYSYVEAWCLGYAINFLQGDINFTNITEAAQFWSHFTGSVEDGSGLKFGFDKIGPFLLIVYIINFFLIYRGISKGIEKFTKIAVPTLIAIAIIVLIRVLTLGAPDKANPEQNINNGLGFMWNPTKVFIEEYGEGKWKSQEIIGETAIREGKSLAASEPEKYRIIEIGTLDQLKRPRLWLAAASQVFFSLAVGFGAIMVYASYTKPDDDLVLSNLSAVSANEFSEVALGGLISIPAAYAFLGAAGVVGQSIFGLGFNVLPLVFMKMPFGHFFGFLFFFLLFIASISGVLCQLQSGIAFFEETLDIERKRAVILTGFVTLLSCMLVIWFTKDIKAMDTFDFWIGQFMIFTVSMVNIIIFGWAFGLKNIYEEAHKGSIIRIPNFFKPIIKYICPIFLLSIFLFWVIFDVLGFGGGNIDYHIRDIIGGNGYQRNSVAILVVINIALLILFWCLIVSRVKKYKEFIKKEDGNVTRN